jgi:hypothetical protein
MAIKIVELTQALRRVEALDFQDCSLVRVLKPLSMLRDAEQKILLKHVTGQDLDFDHYLDMIRKKFVLLKQCDEDGDYHALGFGESCTSVATWDCDKVYTLDDVDFTSECSETHMPKCKYLEDFMKFWIDYYGAEPEDFLSELFDGVERLEGGRTFDPESLPPSGEI